MTSNETTFEDWWNDKSIIGDPMVKQKAQEAWDAALILVAMPHIDFLKEAVLSLQERNSKLEESSKELEQTVMVLTKTVLESL